MSAELAALWPIGFLLLSLGLVLGIVYALSFIGGWNALARHYREASPFTGSAFRFQSIQLAGWVGYNGCVRAGADAFGLFLSIWPVLRVGHPALHVPWTEVSARLERYWWVTVVRLRFAREPEIAVRISVRLARRLAQVSAGRFDLGELG